MYLSPGQIAPDFHLISDKNVEYGLKSFKGKNIILYFYPKDDTPGCTLESCGFRDHYADFQQLNTEIVGVSKDSVSSHQRFKAKYELPFILLADPEAIICEAYAVMGERRLYGKTYYGMSRSTFLIDDHGLIQRIWRDVNVNSHITEVMAAVKELKL